MPFFLFLKDFWELVQVCTISASKEILVIGTYKYSAKNKGHQSPYNKWPCRAQKMATCQGQRPPKYAQTLAFLVGFLGGGGGSPPHYPLCQRTRGTSDGEKFKTIWLNKSHNGAEAHGARAGAVAIATGKAIAYAIAR